MTEKHTDETRAESAVDRELGKLLAVDPSPEFLARVGERVAAEPELVHWRYTWWSLAATVGVLVVAVAVFRPGQPEDSRNARMAGAPVGETASLPPSESPRVPAEVDSTSVPLPQQIPDDAIASTVPSEPDPVSPLSEPHVTVPPPFARVVISQGEAAALTRMFTQLREGRVAVLNRAPLFAPKGPSDSPAEVTIPPVIVEPVMLTFNEGAFE